MKQLILYLLLGMFALLALGSCTNDESDDGLEVLTPNEETETGIAQPALQKVMATDTVSPQ